MIPDRSHCAVIVTLDLGEAFDAAKLVRIAEGATPKFRAIPGLVSKTFTVDHEARQAVNFYVWESEQAAREFFSEQTIAAVTRAYGVRPALRFIPIAAHVRGPAALPQT